MYHITITKKREPTEAELKLDEEARRERRGFGSMDCGRPHLIESDGRCVERVLDVELTEAEFAAVKKGVLEAV